MNEQWSARVSKLGRLSPEQRLHLFEVLAHNLTVAARGAWIDPGLAPLDQVEALKQLNECLHRVTARVWVQRLNTHEWTDEDFVTLLAETEERLHPRLRGSIADAFERTYASTATYHMGWSGNMLSNRPTENDDFFRELEAERTRAIVNRDLTAIERLHAPEYELITPAGRVWSRARYIEAIAAEPFYASWECGPIQVRRTPAMAVVRYAAKLTFPSGKVVDCWHTDSYELRGDVWQAVWSQATARPTPSTSQAVPT